MNQELLSPLCETYTQYPVELERAQDCFVYGVDGKEYLDLYGGHASCGAGHSNIEVIEAIYNQGKQLAFYSNLARIPIRAKGAQLLLEWADSGHQKVFFCNTGAEANENALKMSIKATGRKKIVAMKKGWHGRSMLAMTATDDPSWQKTFSPRIQQAVHIEPNNINEMKANVDTDTAAVILEPIQSIGGVVVMSDEFLLALRARCTEVGALLIFDEVQTGSGRTGRPFVSSRSAGICSDMTTTAKSLANGFPMGAVLMTKEVDSTVQKGDLGATFGGGPMAVAAMMATVNFSKKNNLPANALAFEKEVRSRASKIGIQAVYGKGCLLGLDMGTDVKAIKERLFSEGVIAGGCSNPNVLHLLPPLTIKSEHVDRFFMALSKCLDS